MGKIGAEAAPLVLLFLDREAKALAGAVHPAATLFSIEFPPCALCPKLCPVAGWSGLPLLE
jgi:hypothetical protein